MFRDVWICAALMLAIGARVDADDKKDAKESKPITNSSMEKLKKLAGEWVAADEKGKPTTNLVSVFKVTAAGSAVHETIFPGKPYEMVTLYHLSGKDLVLTHYCAQGNQPHMKLDPSSTDKQLTFKFAGGSNLDAAKDMHMHEGSIRIIDDDNIEWSWQAYDKGKPAEDHKISMKLMRKK